MTPATRQLIEETKKLEAAATKEPWEWMHGNQYLKHFDGSKFETLLSITYAANGYAKIEVTNENAALIVHLRNNIAALLRVIEEQEAVLDAAEITLNKRRVTNPDECHCSRCLNVKRKPFRCELCGYSGEPIVCACCCYDTHCAGGELAGSGCPHGSLQCPACDDNSSIDGFEIIRDVRAALAARRAAEQGEGKR